MPPNTPSNVSNEQTKGLPFQQFPDLPNEIQRFIYSLVDVPSVCRAYVAFAPYWSVGPAADYLKKRTVNVSLVATTRSDTAINFDTLAKLPPCDVSVEATVRTWPHTTRRLDQVTVRSLSVDMNGEFGTRFHGNFHDLKHPLKSLKLFSVSLSTSQIPASVQHLQLSLCSQSFMRNLDTLENLEKLVLDSLLDNQITLPHSLVDISLAGEFHVDCNLPKLRVARDCDRYNLPWSQMETVTDCDGIPKVTSLDNLRSIHVRSSAVPVSFRGIWCPKLTVVKIFGYRADFRINDDDASSMFDDSQMAQLTELIAPDFTVTNFTPFESLQNVHVKLVEPLTDRLVLPSALETLAVSTEVPVTGVPSQIKTLCVAANHNDVSIASDNLRSVTLSQAHDVILSCPRLTCLKVSEFSGSIKLDIPKLESADIDGGKCDVVSVLSQISAASLKISYCSFQSLILNNPMDRLVLNGCKLDELTVEAWEVDIRMTIISRRTSITADTVNIHIYDEEVPAKLSLRCRKLSTPILDPRCYRDVESLTLWPKDHASSKFIPHNTLTPNALVDCQALEKLELKEISIASTKDDPLVIPATVKSLIIKDIMADELWLEFRDESRLEHFELTLSEYAANDSPCFTMETLGLHQKPPSFYCPLLENYH
ncbi:hypothetical protein DIURU_005198 [Diutina rugosa]|uniref:Uncharacterized protein n=1 Tax=Diutina rugosa TaxID=5481 RepID=A0A642UE95_DIURU|nr:uncharacterized protein DIURU_005198 [Diutina rugosa]KAA8897482.1 hypothetical protein DIURU_005198 [Diutina rugosa]